MGAKVLIIEDDPTLQETLEYNLVRQGYQVSKASDGVSGLQAARRECPDLILLDLMLPGLDGFELCRRLRAETNVPILMLTARADQEDKVLGLELGADDYVTKPFQMRELLARVRALLRRGRIVPGESAEAERPGERLLLGDLLIDTARGEVLLRDQPLALTRKEYELMLFLAHHKGRVLSRDLILDRVWGWDYVGGSRTVDVHVRWLRQKIEPDPSQPRRIVTVRGMGYRFEG